MVALRQAGGVTVFSQRNPKWAHKRLGTGRETIGQAGCLISCVASMLADWGQDTDPGRLNAWLTEHGGYYRGNLFVWRSVTPLGATLHRMSYCRYQPAPLHLLRDDLAAGRAVICQVDWTPGGEIDQHWVRVLAICENETRIMDPWQVTAEALTTLEAHYCRDGWDAARAIFQAAVYRPTIASLTTSPPAPLPEGEGSDVPLMWA